MPFCSNGSKLIVIEMNMVCVPVSIQFDTNSYLQPFGIQIGKGPFNNYMNRIFPFFDHLPTVSKQSFSVKKKRQTNHLPLPVYCVIKCPLNTKGRGNVAMYLVPNI